MNVVAKFFLRAKHWEIFFLLFGIFIVGNLALMTTLLTTAPSQEVFGKAAILYGGLTVLFMFFFLGWFWSMGSFLSSIVRPALRLRMQFFRFAIVYVLMYLPVFVAIFESIATNPWLFAVIFPLHLFATYCILYLLYFVSKSLVLAESGKPASFYDYSGPFFLLWLFPIGVWIIQPRVNRLYEDRRNLERASGDIVV